MFELNNHSYDKTLQERMLTGLLFSACSSLGMSIGHKKSSSVSQMSLHIVTTKNVAGYKTITLTYLFPSMTEMELAPSYN